MWHLGCLISLPSRLPSRPSFQRPADRVRARTELERRRRRPDPFAFRLLAPAKNKFRRLFLSDFVGRQKPKSISRPACPPKVRVSHRAFPHARNDWGSRSFLKTMVATSYAQSKFSIRPHRRENYANRPSYPNDSAAICGPVATRVRVKGKPRSAGRRGYSVSCRPFRTPIRSWRR